MAPLLLWRICIILEGLILFRGLRRRMFAKYPYLFTYVACALADDILEYTHYYLFRGASYAEWYWVGEFFTLLVGCGIILEISRCVLSPYAGAARFARMAGSSIFVTIACFAVIYPRLMPTWSHAGTMFELERDLRTVQAIFLVGLLGVIGYYRIAIGKNVRGIAVGYGLFIGAVLVSRAIRSYVGVPLPGTWNTIMLQAAYATALVVWIATLWSYHPNPVPDASIRLEEDYEAFAARTKGMLGAIRIHLVKAARP